jgi:hypothetical protein
MNATNIVPPRRRYATVTLTVGDDKRYVSLRFTPRRPKPISDTSTRWIEHKEQE